MLNIWLALGRICVVYMILFRVSGALVYGSCMLRSGLGILASFEQYLRFGYMATIRKHQIKDAVWGWRVHISQPGTVD